jgi:Mlc titration factor MtfA (ptsG expression regulator)
MRALRRRDRHGLPAHWRDILAARSAHFRLLDDDEQARLGELADHLLLTRRWEAARGVTLDDEIRTVIAGQGALVVLGLDETWLEGVSTIVVRRGAMRRSAPTPTWGRVAGIVDGSPSPIDGQADHHRGPVMINWTSARREASNPRLGRDVTIHEFSHKLDMLDGIVDGTPPMDDAELRARWVEVCTAEYDALRAGPPDPLLRPYATTNVGEFFAVAAEVFFARPVELAVAKPALYDVLRRFFRQDTAARVLRAAAPTAG